MSFQTRMSFFLMLNIKKIFWRMLVIKQSMVLIDFYSISFSTMEVSGGQQLFGSLKFFRISHFVFNIRNKLLQVWNDTRVSKWWQNFNFWVNYTFNQTVLCVIVYCKEKNLAVNKSVFLLNNYKIKRFNLSFYSSSFIFHTVWLSVVCWQCFVISYSFILILVDKNNTFTFWI